MEKNVRGKKKKDYFPSTCMCTNCFWPGFPGDPGEKGEKGNQGRSGIGDPGQPGLPGKDVYCTINKLMAIFYLEIKTAIHFLLK